MLITPAVWDVLEQPDPEASNGAFFPNVRIPDMLRTEQDYRARLITLVVDVSFTYHFLALTRQSVCQPNCANHARPGSPPGRCSSCLQTTDTRGSTPLHRSMFRPFSSGSCALSNLLRQSPPIWPTQWSIPTGPLWPTVEQPKLSKCPTATGASSATGTGHQCSPWPFTTIARDARRAMRTSVSGVPLCFGFCLVHAPTASFVRGMG
jgi:hypothetical protein